MDEVGIRALKQNASAVVARAAGGEVIVVTDRGRPVAQLSPLPSSTLDGLVEAGLARPPKRATTDLPTPVDIGRLLSDDVIAGRDDERY
ncbi:MAG: type II toxin-antitoxin system prevent-host-death family antitoxin [Ilumatobacter fluminis]|uniref:type II toxin-antitoxin system Phd/YefM family antitoxin n=1 Tax=Ilumatobacter fluminis TaxID=467091 RepID=UPI0032EA9E79